MVWIFGIALLLMIYLVWTRQGFLRSEAAQRWKFFFPSWRFFEDIGHRYTLWVRLADDQDWILLRKPLKRHRRLLWYNPQGNLTLALDSVVEQFVIELQYQLETKSSFSDFEIQQMTLFKLVQQQALFLVNELQLETTPSSSRRYRICQHWQGDHLPHPKTESLNASSMEELFQW